MNRLPILFSTLPFLCLIASGCACTTGTGSGSDQNQPPVIVVQTPPEGGGAGAADSAYPGTSWQQPQSTAANSMTTSGANDEPYEVSALLNGQKSTTDKFQDQVGDKAFNDITMVSGVADQKFLYGRITTRAKMQGADGNELRFWIVQTKGKAQEMALVELKYGSPKAICEISAPSLGGEQIAIERCFWAGDSIDFRIPLDKLPPNIDSKYSNEENELFHISSFETCCQDEERTKPWDELETSIPVQKIPDSSDEAGSN